MRFPRIQGADAAGTIAAAGEGVDPARVGERVLVDPWLPAPGDGPDNGVFPYFGSERDGGYADYATVPGENAIPVDSPLSDAELATFPCAYGTAENLVARTGLRPGETVVILGASGGVGSAAVQLCRLRGARVLAVSVPAKAELLKSLGADEVIDRGGDLEADVRHAAGGPVDVALDVAGGALFMRVLRALRQGGRYSSCGAIAGPLVEFDLRLLIYKDLQLTGATIVPPGTMRRIVRLIERIAASPAARADVSAGRAGAGAARVHEEEPRRQHRGDDGLIGRSRQASGARVTPPSFVAPPAPVSRLGMSRTGEFIDFPATAGVPVVDYTPEEPEDELKSAL